MMKPICHDLSSHLRLRAFNRTGIEAALPVNAMTMRAALRG